jgi:hypothetical protein
MCGKQIVHDWPEVELPTVNAGAVPVLIMGFTLVFGIMTANFNECPFTKNDHNPI